MPIVSSPRPAELLARGPHDAKRANKMRRAWATAAFCLLSSCAVQINEPVTDTIRTIGRTISEVSTAIEIRQSFLFAAADIFFPGGVTEDPHGLPKLTEEQLQAVDAFLQQRVRNVYEVAGGLTKAHPAYREAGTGPALFKRVKFTTTGQPEAVIDSDGVVFLDVRVLQAVFRAVVLDWMMSADALVEKGARREPGWLMGRERRQGGKEANEIEAIRSFNRFVQGVKDAPATTELSLLKHFFTARASGVADRMFAAMDGMMAEKRMRSLAQSAQERFASSIDFIFAHEMAHRTLGHLDKRSLPEFTRLSDAEKCEVLRKHEVDADEFASLVVVAGQYRGSRAHTITSRGAGQYNLDGSGYVPDIYGYVSLFGRGMAIAGFDNRLGSGGCIYPPTASRLATVHSFVAYSRDVLDVALQQEGIVKGQWFASRDDRRLDSILAAGEAQYAGEGGFLAAMMQEMTKSLMDMISPSLELDETMVSKPPRSERQQLASRYRHLVSPVLAQRFSGRI